MLCEKSEKSLSFILSFSSTKKGKTTQAKMSPSRDCTIIVTPQGSEQQQVKDRNVAAQTRHPRNERSSQFDTNNIWPSKEEQKQVHGFKSAASTSPPLKTSTTRPQLLPSQPQLIMQNHIAKEISEEYPKQPSNQNPKKKKPKQLTLGDLMITTALPESTPPKKTFKKHGRRKMNEGVIGTLLLSHSQDELHQSPRVETPKKSDSFLLAESSFPALPSTSNFSLLTKYNTISHTTALQETPNHQLSNVQSHHIHSAKEMRQVLLPKEEPSVAKMKSAGTNKIVTLSSKTLIYPKRNEDPAMKLRNNYSHNFSDTMHISSKGKVKRLGPRKKKFSTLKKRVLVERLQKWKESQELELPNDFRNVPGSSATTNNSSIVNDGSHTKHPDPVLSFSPPSSFSSKIICLVNFIDLEHDDLSDEDEYSEICSDVSHLASLIGPIDGVFIPRSCTADDGSSNSINLLVGFAFVSFQNAIDALAARHCWKGMVLGGRVIDSVLISSDKELSGKVFASPASAKYCGTRIVLRDILTEDDLADYECMEESFSDIHQLVSKLVPRGNDVIKVGMLDGDKYGVIIDLQESSESAISILMSLDGTVFSGKPIAAEFLVDLRLLPFTKTKEQLLGSSPTSVHIHSESSEVHDEHELHTGTVELWNVLSEDDLLDHECLEKNKRNIVSAAAKFGQVSSIEVCMNDAQRGHMLVTFEGGKDNAIIAANALHGEMFGCCKICAKVVCGNSARASVKNFSTAVKLDVLNAEIYKVVLSNILSDDDLEDDECFEESKEDILLFVSKCGEVNNIEACRTGENRGNVLIAFNGGEATAVSAARTLNGKMFGGGKVYAFVTVGMCTVMHGDPAVDVTDLTKEKVVLSNFLSNDDLEDEECLEECKEDILSLMRKYGEVASVEVCREASDVGNVLISYVKSGCAAVAVAELNGVNIGGTNICVQLWGGNSIARGTEVSSNAGVLPSPYSVSKGITLDNVCQSEATCMNIMNTSISLEPIFTKTGKLIPERWAECKRVPKVQNSDVKPSYVRLLQDETATPLLLEMLGSLMKFQLRSKDDANARARRRLVVGFREVSRGLRAKKVKLVVMANNLDEYEAVSEKTQEVIDLCRSSEIPILFELNKRKLGKALGKTIKMSIVGVQSADGAHDQFKKLKVIVESDSNQKHTS